MQFMTNDHQKTSNTIRNRYSFSFFQLGIVNRLTGSFIGIVVGNAIIIQFSNLFNFILLVFLQAFF